MLFRLCLALILFLVVDYQSAQASTLPNADQLLIQDQFKEAEEAYRPLLPGDKSGNAHVGFIYALMNQTDTGKFDYASKVLHETILRYHEKPPNVLAVSGYFTYRVGIRQAKGSTKRKLYMKAAEEFCTSALDKNPEIIQPLLTLALLRSDSKQDLDSLRYLDQAVDRALKIARVGVNDEHVTSKRFLTEEYRRCAKLALVKQAPDEVVSIYRKILALLDLKYLFYPNISAS